MEAWSVHQKIKGNLTLLKFEGATSLCRAKQGNRTVEDRGIQNIVLLRTLKHTHVAKRVGYKKMESPKLSLLAPTSVSSDVLKGRCCIPL